MLSLLGAVAFPVRESRLPDLSFSVHLSVHLSLFFISLFPLVKVPGPKPRKDLAGNVRTMFQSYPVKIHSLGEIFHELNVIL